MFLHEYYCLYELNEHVIFLIFFILIVYLCVNPEFL